MNKILHLIQDRLLAIERGLNLMRLLIVALVIWLFVSCNDYSYGKRVITLNSISSMKVTTIDSGKSAWKWIPDDRCLLTLNDNDLVQIEAKCDDFKVNDEVTLILKKVEKKNDKNNKH